MCPTKAFLVLRVWCLQMGLVGEPGGVAHQLVTGTASGELKYIDFRMGSDGGGKLGVYKTLQAHSKCSITALVGHPHSPLIASATTTQVPATAGSPALLREA